jgi:hypothetical protein
MNSPVTFTDGPGSNLRFGTPSNWAPEDRADLINRLRDRYALLNNFLIIPEEPADETSLVVTPPANLTEWQQLRSEALAVPLRLHPDVEVRSWLGGLA